MFDGDDLMTFIKQATYVTVNDYEAELLQERTGLSEQEIAQHVQALIVTKGGEGSMVHTAEQVLQIPPVAVSELQDPTGCGDAYRAGLIFGIMNKMGWETTCRIASLMGAIKIQHHGTQNHSFTMDEFKQQFEQAYGYSF
jgi:adenosine kinase